MFSKKLLAVFVVFGATISAYATLQERIATQAKKIDALKTNIKSGTAIKNSISAKCGSRCSNKCGNSCRAY